jgi:hypothetical protein
VIPGTVQTSLRAQDRVEDIRAYIAPSSSNARAARLGEHIVKGELCSRSTCPSRRIGQ